MKAVINKRLLESLKPKDKPYEVRDTKLKGFILRVQPSGVMTYIVEYSRGKRVVIAPVEVLTPVEARQRSKEILADFIRGVDPQEAKRKAKAHTFESYITEVYGPWVKVHHAKSTDTITKLRIFFPSFGNVKLGNITAWSIERWRNEKIKAGIKPSTINRNINALKACLNRAVRWGFLDANPLNDIKPLKIDRAPKVRYLTDDEEEALRGALDAREERIRAERDSANAWRAARGYKLLPDLRKLPFADYLKPMILLAINTGLRRGELFNLEWGDVDFNHALLTVRGTGAKSGQTRHIPLNQEAFDVLLGWRAAVKDSGLVFPGKGGKRFDNINTAWRNLLKDAGIDNFRFHDLRHHFASRLVMAGVDLNTVRELLGHSDIKMTLRYAHLAPEVKAQAVSRLVRKTPARKVSSLS